MDNLNISAHKILEICENFEEFFVFKSRAFGAYSFFAYICEHTKKHTTMKNIRLFCLRLFLLTVSVITLNACDVYIENDDYNHHTDRQRANIISGQWKGDFGMFYKARHPRTGEWIHFDADYSNIRFYSDYQGARSGWGKQVDFYRNGPYRYQYYHFNWSVRGGVLYLVYPYDASLNVEIHDYYLDRSVFTGRIGYSNFKFKLFKLMNFNDWNSFNGNYSFAPYDDWVWSDGNYAPKKSITPFAPDVPQTEETDTIFPSAVVRGNKGNDAPGR